MEYPEIIWSLRRAMVANKGHARMWISAADRPALEAYLGQMEPLPVRSGLPKEPGDPICNFDGVWLHSCPGLEPGQIAGEGKELLSWPKD